MFEYEGKLCACEEIQRVLYELCIYLWDRLRYRMRHCNLRGCRFRSLLFVAGVGGLEVQEPAK